MRLRPIAVLSVAAAAALLLAGCSGGGENTASPTPSAGASCLTDATAGDDSNAVTLADGDALGATVPTDLAFGEIQRTITGGDGGDVLAAGSLVSGQYLIYDGATGELLLDSATTSASGDGLVPILIDDSAPTMWMAAIDCAPLGSTVVMTVPGSAIGAADSKYVVVARSAEELPTTATGVAQEPVAGAPEVTLAADGTPTVTIPDTAAPADLQISVLKKGDGPTVADGDQVVLQYLGVAWDTKEEFDSSWSRGRPSAFTTTGVYEGFGDALVGQTVGSQVLVTMPPAMGATSGDLVGKTLTFVIDILGTQRVETATQ